MGGISCQLFKYRRRYQRFNQVQANTFVHKIIRFAPVEHFA